MRLRPQWQTRALLTVNYEETVSNLRVQVVFHVEFNDGPADKGTAPGRCCLSVGMRWSAG